LALARGSRRDLNSGLARVHSLVRIDINCECSYLGVMVCFFFSFSSLFLLSRTAAAQLLAKSCSPPRFAWTAGRRSARGIPVRLTSCSRSPALADWREAPTFSPRSSSYREIISSSSSLSSADLTTSVRVRAPVCGKPQFLLTRLFLGVCASWDICLERLGAENSRSNAFFQ
jgi:hypothetical protein